MLFASGAAVSRTAAAAARPAPPAILPRSRCWSHCCWSRRWNRFRSSHRSPSSTTAIRAVSGTTLAGAAAVGAFVAWSAAFSRRVVVGVGATSSVGRRQSRHQGTSDPSSSARRHLLQLTHHEPRPTPILTLRFRSDSPLRRRLARILGSRARPPLRARFRLGIDVVAPFACRDDTESRRPRPSAALLPARLRGSPARASAPTIPTVETATTAVTTLSPNGPAASLRADRPSDPPRRRTATFLIEPGERHRELFPQQPQRTTSAAPTTGRQPVLAVARRARNSSASVAGTRQPSAVATSRVAQPVQVRAERRPRAAALEARRAQLGSPRRCERRSCSSPAAGMASRSSSATGSDRRMPTGDASSTLVARDRRQPAARLPDASRRRAEPDSA